LSRQNSHAQRCQVRCNDDLVSSSLAIESCRIRNSSSTVSHRRSSCLSNLAMAANWKYRRRGTGKSAIQYTSRTRMGAVQAILHKNCDDRYLDKALLTLSVGLAVTLPRVTCRSNALRRTGIHLLAKQVPFGPWIETQPEARSIVRCCPSSRQALHVCLLLQYHYTAFAFYYQPSVHLFLDTTVPWHTCAAGTGNYERSAGAARARMRWRPVRAAAARGATRHERGGLLPTRLLSAESAPVQVLPLEDVRLG